MLWSGSCWDWLRAAQEKSLGMCQEFLWAWALVQAPACLTCRNQTHKMVKACVVGGLFIHNKLETCYNLHMAKLLWRSGFNLLGPWKVALRPYCPPPSSTPLQEPVARRRGCQWGGQKFTRASFPGGVQKDTACKYLHGLAIVPSVRKCLNYVLAGKAANPLCKLRPLTERVGTWTAGALH